MNACRKAVGITTKLIRKNSIHYRSYANRMNGGLLTWHVF